MLAAFWAFLLALTPEAAVVQDDTHRNELLQDASPQDKTNTVQLTNMDNNGDKAAELPSNGEEPPLEREEELAERKSSNYCNPIDKEKSTERISVGKEADKRYVEPIAEKKQASKTIAAKNEKESAGELDTAAIEYADIAENDPRI